MIERIKTLMKERGLKGTQLATQLALPKNAISEWSSGKAKPGTEAIIKIANYFGVTTDYLLTGNSEPLINKSDSQPEISESEEILLNAYRSADITKRRIILQNVLETARE